MSKLRLQDVGAFLMSPGNTMAKINPSASIARGLYNLLGIRKKAYSTFELNNIKNLSIISFTPSLNSSSSSITFAIAGLH